MKKVVLLVLMLSTAVLLTACGNSSDELEALRNLYRIQQEENQSLQEENDELRSQVQELLETINESTPSPTAAPITNPVLYTDDYIEIFYSHCEESEYTDGKYMVFLIIENKTDVPIVTSISSFAVDGWNLSDAFGYQEISANSKSYVEVSSEQLPTLNPTNISGDLYIGDRSETAWGSRSYDAIFNSVSLVDE